MYQLSGTKGLNPLFAAKLSNTNSWLALLVQYFGGCSAEEEKCKFCFHVTHVLFMGCNDAFVYREERGGG